MRQLFVFFKKFALVILVLAIGLVAIPSSGVYAAGLQNETTPPITPSVSNVRLELLWARAQMVYQRQGFLLSMADNFIARAQNLIDKANSKGWDTSAVQAALDAFDSVIPAARAAHLPGTAIIANHTGFTMDGEVTDRTAALETTKSLVQVLKDTRTAMNGTGMSLRKAVKAFRDAHRLDQVPVTP
jgi:hypothetical protein